MHNVKILQYMYSDMKCQNITTDFIYFRGFLKSDKLLGTVNVKLLPLETQCTVHDSYDVSFFVYHKNLNNFDILETRGPWATMAHLSEQLKILNSAF